MKKEVKIKNSRIEKTIDIWHFSGFIQYVSVQIAVILSQIHVFTIVQFDIWVEVNKQGG